MPKYSTGLVTTGYWRFPTFPYKSRSWTVDLVKTTRSCDVSETPQFPEGGSSSRVRGREVVIDAKDENVARKAAFLILAASDVLEGSSFLSHVGGQLDLCELKESHVAKNGDQYEERAIQSRRNIPAGSLLAVKIGRSRTLTYALSKVWLSYQMFSIAGIDLDPTHSPTIPKSQYPFDHVAYAQAIVLAYAAIEELELEIRSTAQKPSRIKDKWNPEVRDELIKRLENAGVNLNEKYPWNLRGPMTILERERPPNMISPTPWAKWRVRDGFVEVIDAIAHVSWLRSKVSAHRSKYEFMRVLSVYEVVNCQYLARRLFLERCGFWRKPTSVYGPAGRA